MSQDGLSKPAEPGPRPFAGAAAAAAKLQISSFRFLRINAYTGIGAGDQTPPDITTRIAFTRPAVTRDSSHRIVFTTTFLFRVAAETSADLVAFDLSATTEIIYVATPDSDISDSDLEEFGRVNVPFNAWAYWRELSQSALARLGLPVVPLPLFRVHDAARLMVERHDS